jgi:hypothetical protein
MFAPQWRLCPRQLALIPARYVIAARSDSEHVTEPVIGALRGGSQMREIGTSGLMGGEGKPNAQHVIAPLLDSRLGTRR